MSPNTSDKSETRLVQACGTPLPVRRLCQFVRECGHNGTVSIASMCRDYLERHWPPGEKSAGRRVGYAGAERAQVPHIHYSPRIALRTNMSTGGLKQCRYNNQGSYYLCNVNIKKVQKTFRQDKYFCHNFCLVKIKILVDTKT